MKTLIFFIALILTLQAQAQKGYRITRYEQKSNELFICVNSKKIPVYVEKFLTETERKDSITILKAVEDMVAELQIKEDEYVKPEIVVSEMKRAARLEKQTDTTRIKAAKVLKLEKRKAPSDYREAGIDSTIFRRQN